MQIPSPVKRLSSQFIGIALAASGATILIAGSHAELRAQTSPAGRPVTTVGKDIPRTPDGHPDLQGVWANNMATPLERPKELANKPLLSDAELRDFRQKAAELFDGAGDTAFGDGVYNAVLAAQAAAKAGDTSYKKGGTGDYNSFWLVDREFENRTSLIFDPPDGRMPPLTPEAQKRNAANAEDRKMHPADGPENLPLAVRCLTYGVPRLGGLNAGYNSYYEFVQTPGAVAIHSEMIHEARIIPLDGRPHVPSAIRQWQGDPRGHWDGDTLVVDTTNFSTKSNYMGAHENLHVVERFTLVADDTLHHEITVDDPTTWTRPWSALIKLRRAKPGEHIYEFACHEGNSAMVGILGGERAEEKRRQSATTK